MASRGAAANATLGLVLVALLLLSKDSHALILSNLQGTGTGAIDSPGPIAQVQPGGGSIASAPTTSRLPQVRGANATAPTAQPKHPMYGVTEGSLKPQECSGRCSARCSATQYKKPCLFFCNKCCATCLCVPPGTYGNKQFCPCYNNWKTKRGGPKCP